MKARLALMLRPLVLVATVVAMAAGIVGVTGPAAEPASAEVASHDVVGFDRSPTSGGYRAITSTGTVYTMGDLPSLPSYTGALNRPIVSAVNTVSGGGLTAAAADGGVFTFGDAEFYGSMGGRPLNQPIVDIERTSSGRGYWLVAADGGVFSFGDAAFYGSMGGRPLNQPVVAMAATPTGRGYILVAADGGVFTFGDAAFHGSMGGQSLNRPVVDVAMGPNGGYVMLAADGGVFTFDYPFHGSAVADIQAGNSAVRISRAFDGDGYSIASANGMMYNFGTSAHGNPDSPVSPLRDRIAAVARAELAKNPTETRNNDVVRYNGGTGAYAPYNHNRTWCADFATWVWQQAGVGNPPMSHCGNGRGNSIQSWAAANREFRPLAAGARVGDLILYGGENNCTHVAIVVGVRSDGFIQTIGGNERGTTGNGGVRFTNWTRPQLLSNHNAYGYASPLRGA